MVSIRLAGISKSFGQTLAVDNVSLKIARGELFFLLGPSGCGKTTILRMIAGFAEPDAGEIYFDEKPIRRVPPHKRNTALVFQNYALWPHMNVAANVAYGLRERRVPKQERKDLVEKALQRVRMAQYSARMPNELSGGQQQRVALARALVIEPDAVLMDEPLSNLDASLRRDMRHEIRRIHDETRVTMLYVTHDQQEALSMADNVAVMSMGRVAQVGTPREVYRSPQSRFVANFIGEANIITGELVAVDGQWGRVRTDLGEFKARLGAVSGKAGSPVDCMIRPECLQLGSGTQNSFRARVSSSVYLGEIEQLVLEAGGRALKAVVANPGDDMPRPGAEVPAHFAPQDAVLLPQEAEGGNS